MEFEGGGSLRIRMSACRRALRKISCNLQIPFLVGARVLDDAHKIDPEVPQTKIRGDNDGILYGCGKFTLGIHLT